MQINNSDNLSFQARLGNNLRTTLLKKEFGGNKAHLKKFEDTFEKLFDEVLEKDTVLEMTTKGRFELSHPTFPKYKIPFKLMSHEQNLLDKIMKTHPLNYNYNECSLFKKIISKEVKRGVSLEHLNNIVSEKFAQSERQEYFFDFTRQAKRILEENPEAELTNLEFSEMSNREIRELLEDESNGIMDRLRGIK